jgi:hypothetical protein
MKTKTFDCVEMKRVAQEKIRDAVKGMTAEEEIRYFREGADAFEQRIRQARDTLAKQPDRE